MCLLSFLLVWSWEWCEWEVKITQNDFRRQQTHIIYVFLGWIRDYKVPSQNGRTAFVCRNVLLQFYNCRLDLFMPLCCISTLRRAFDNSNVMLAGLYELSFFICKKWQSKEINSRLQFVKYTIVRSTWLLLMCLIISTYF